MKRARARLTEAVLLAVAGLGMGACVAPAPVATVPASDPVAASAPIYSPPYYYSYPYYYGYPGYWPPYYAPAYYAPAYYNPFPFFLSTSFFFSSHSGGHGGHHHGGHGGHHH